MGVQVVIPEYKQKKSGSALGTLGMVGGGIAGGVFGGPMGAVAGMQAGRTLGGIGDKVASGQKLSVDDAVGGAAAAAGGSQIGAPASVPTASVAPAEPSLGMSFDSGMSSAGAAPGYGDAMTRRMQQIGLGKYLK